MKAEDFLLAVQDELGDAYDLVRDEHVLRWVNRGRARLGLYEQKVAPISWANFAATVDLPADFAVAGALVPDRGFSLAAHQLTSTQLVFLDPPSVREGTGQLFYGAHYPEVNGEDDSTMPPLADEAAVHYALARYFARIASTRSQFRRYVAVTGQNGVDVQDLLDLARAHDADFEAAKAELAVPPPATFFGE